eukprot:1999776-Amphidinium_carterae.2
MATTGQPIGKRWLVYTNSVAVYDELQSLSRNADGNTHAWRVVIPYVRVITRLGSPLRHTGLLGGGSRIIR